MYKLSGKLLWEDSHRAYWRLYMHFFVVKKFTSVILRLRSVNCHQRISYYIYLEIIEVSATAPSLSIPHRYKYYLPESSPNAALFTDIQCHVILYKAFQ